MPIEWTDDLSRVNWDELAALYRAAPLGEKKPADLELVFRNSMFRCFAFDSARLAGAGRVLADGRDCAYLCDIAVLPSHQGNGLGKEIISQLVGLSRSHRKIILYAVPGKERLYEKFGFRRMTTAMAIFDNQADAKVRGYITERDVPAPHLVCCESAISSAPDQSGPRRQRPHD
jgi:ribosomal protein S18 acetylase RimI-like enzyme